MRGLKICSQSSMRIERFTSQFKRDFKKVEATPRYRDIDSLLAAVVPLLLADQPLPKERKDHPLRGKYQGCRECHVCPNLLLIYQKFPGLIVFERLGSHPDLFR